LKNPDGRGADGQTGFHVVHARAEQLAITFFQRLPLQLP